MSSETCMEQYRYRYLYARHHAFSSAHKEHLQCFRRGNVLYVQYTSTGIISDVKKWMQDVSQCCVYFQCHSVVEHHASLQVN